MATIRSLFHQVGNCHNQITIVSGVLMEVIKEGALENINKGEIQKRFSKIIDGLKKIEKSAIKADKTLMQLKPFIYKNLSPDQDMPQQEGN